MKETKVNMVKKQQHRVDGIKTGSKSYIISVFFFMQNGYIMRSEGMFLIHSFRPINNI